MIRVIVTRRASDNRIVSFRVDGHANYAERGRDIVCAGVSAITVGTVNALEALLGVVPDSRMANGFLQAAIPVELAPERQSQVQLLLESMVVMLQSIEDSYGSYIRIEHERA